MDDSCNIVTKTASEKDRTQNSITTTDQILNVVSELCVCNSSRHKVVHSGQEGILKEREHGTLSIRNKRLESINVNRSSKDSKSNIRLGVVT